MGFIKPVLLITFTQSMSANREHADSVLDQPESSRQQKQCCIVNCLSHCPYCSFTPEDAWIVSDDVVALPHPSPLASCHVLVAPRRHVAAFYDLDVGEQRQIWEVLNELRKRITLSLHVEGFDVGFVDGAHDDPGAHTYVHVIPRIPGDHVELPADAEWVNLDS